MRCIGGYFLISFNSRVLNSSCINWLMKSIPMQLRTLLSLTSRLVSSRLTRGKLRSLLEEQEENPLLFGLSAPRSTRIGKPLLPLDKWTAKLRISTLLYQQKVWYEFAAQRSVFVIDADVRLEIHPRKFRDMLREREKSVYEYTIDSCDKYLYVSHRYSENLSVIFQFPFVVSWFQKTWEKKNGLIIINFLITKKNINSINL